jgi:hypothetical protein
MLPREASFGLVCHDGALIRGAKGLAGYWSHGFAPLRSICGGLLVAFRLWICCSEEVTPPPMVRNRQNNTKFQGDSAPLSPNP